MTDHLQLGDLTVLGRWPGAVLKALAVVATHLHPSYDEQPKAAKGGSKDKCVFSSLVVRDFLVAIGFEDATVRGCGVVMAADDLKTGVRLHSLGLGVPDTPDRPQKFNGHVVVDVPSLALLIDTTLYPTIRPAWSGAVTGMMACSYSRWPGAILLDRTVFASAELGLADRTFHIAWIDRPELQWRRSVDFRAKSPRRRAMTRALIGQATQSALRYRPAS